MQKYMSFIVKIKTRETPKQSKLRKCDGKKTKSIPKGAKKEPEEPNGCRQWPKWNPKDAKRAPKNTKMESKGNQRRGDQPQLAAATYLERFLGGLAEVATPSWPRPLIWNGFWAVWQKW